jgi:ABC-type Fe2+-enterobactin transport system substrate-binding protein
LGKHLGNTRGKYEDAAKRLERFGEKLLTVEDSAAAPSLEVDATPAQRPLL